MRAKSVTVLAWASLVLALIGGTFAVATPVGGALKTVLDVIPWRWVPGVILAGLLAWAARDLWLDWEPNHPSVWVAIISPSVAAATAGRLGAKVTDGVRAVLNWADAPLSDWLGTGSSLGLTAGCIVVALLIAQRAVGSGPAGTF